MINTSIGKVLMHNLGDGNSYKTVNWKKNWVGKYNLQTAKLSPKLQARSLEETVNNIYITGLYLDTGIPAKLSKMKIKTMPKMTLLAKAKKYQFPPCTTGKKSQIKKRPSQKPHFA